MSIILAKQADAGNWRGTSGKVGCHSFDRLPNLRETRPHGMGVSGEHRLDSVTRDLG
jgi:hypothetical protein